MPLDPSGSPASGADPLDPANPANPVTAPAVQHVSDLIGTAPAAALAATLDLDAPPAIGDALPPLWHWLYFWSITAQAALGADGHAATGGFLPDLGLPRRMAAGGRLRFAAPLPVGAAATRESRVLSVERKTGRSGPLAFVTVLHEIRAGAVTAIREEQDIVYREAAVPGRPQTPPTPVAAPGGAEWERRVTPTEAMLFRYSALTFNGHRIHYDRDYARDIEGYPDLVVHGPLVATLLLDAAARFAPGTRVAGYAYQAVHPTFAGQPLTLCGRRADDGRALELWAHDHAGRLTMSARAHLA
ncbi:FAS1-like dehydratase domain-containing protein [Burkholderia plantarii]|uniref:FAS1-like dehydratase domain-containing protein n=1 Tax=Burkholderia plantarii TaxID=41899 RepID=UPI000705D796|nr:MaoC family dehydratase N-terminal domain-containing protein [Burkholderia plantarii]ALK30267.1 acyl-CoA dehydrogenase MmgC [Burkholderia plantarii]GLZ18377.1 acyl-CoA dehydrogenase [Burkholderia plantarii]